MGVSQLCTDEEIFSGVCRDVSSPLTGFCPERFVCGIFFSILFKPLLTAQDDLVNCATYIFIYDRAYFQSYSTCIYVLVPSRINIRYSL